MSSAESRRLIEEKARLIFKCFDFNQRGVLTETECTILFISLWRAVTRMTGIISTEPSDASMRLNTRALFRWVAKYSSEVHLQKGDINNEGKVTEAQFVAWAAVAVGKLHRPQRLPDLLFKFNVLDADQYVLEFCIDENNVSTR